MVEASLTTEEVWDDSALVDSWNEAFEEYKKYHSLAVKGEKVDLKIERAEDGLRNGQTAVKAEPVDDLNGVSREPAVEKQASSGAAVQGFVPPSIPADGAMPQALTASVQSEDLKNIMMSWYYAGYYTGLYEGKQQGYASAQQEQKGG